MCTARGLAIRELAVNQSSKYDTSVVELKHLGPTRSSSAVPCQVPLRLRHGDLLKVTAATLPPSPLTLL